MGQREGIGRMSAWQGFMCGFVTAGIVFLIVYEAMTRFAE